MIKDPGDAPMGVSVFRSTGPARMFGVFGVFIGLGLCITGIVVVVAASLKGEGSDAKVFQYTFIILVGFFMTAGSFVLIQSAKTKEFIDAEAAQQTAAAAADEDQGGGAGEDCGGGGGEGKSGNGGGGGGRGGKGAKSGDNSPTDKTAVKGSGSSPPASATTTTTTKTSKKTKKVKMDSVKKP